MKDVDFRGIRLVKFFIPYFLSLSILLLRHKSISVSRNTLNILSKSLPTTKSCSNCGSIKNMTLNDRVYICSECNIKIPRDLNSTFNMIKLSKFSVEHRKTMPLEDKSSALKNLRNVDALSVRLYPLNEEARR